MDGLSGKDFFGGSVFPDNKAFRKLRFARCMKKWQPFGASLSNTELLEICQKWAQKKQQIFFGLTAKNDFDSYIFFLDILILLNGRCIIVVNICEMVSPMAF